MKDERIIVKGTPKKNTNSRIVIIIGAILFLASFAVSLYVFYNGEGYKNFGFGYGGTYYWCTIYEDDFGGFFISEFFNFSCFYGYMLLIGVIMQIVGLVIKFNSEKCEITVTDSRIYGKLAHGKEVDIPLNQITAINKCAFDGISISSIGSVSNFHCIENQDAVIKAISYMLTNSGDAHTAAPQASQDAVASNNSYGDAEKLKEYKGLLDSGIITQEEFDKKKKELLGL